MSEVVTHSVSLRSAVQLDRQPKSPEQEGIGDRHRAVSIEVGRAVTRTRAGAVSAET